MKPKHSFLPIILRVPKSRKENLSSGTFGKSKRTNNYNKTQSPGPSLAFSYLSVHTHLSLGKAQESIAETMLWVFMEFWVWVVIHEYDLEVKVKGWWERQS